jgi:hypothetical protein
LLPEHTVPQPIVLPGKTHAPVPSQSVAPQGGPTGLHCFEQQWKPTPIVPQIPLWHCELIEHGEPSPPEVVPEELVLEEELPGRTHPPDWQTYPLTQSAVVVHDVLHAVALAHTRLAGHGIGSPELQVPRPLQVLWVSSAAEQVLPHGVPALRCSHAPPIAQ